MQGRGGPGRGGRGGRGADGGGGQQNQEEGQGELLVDHELPLVAGAGLAELVAGPGFAQIGVVSGPGAEPPLPAMLTEAVYNQLSAAMKLMHDQEVRVHRMWSVKRQA
jgi:hypothetical protein